MEGGGGGGVFGFNDTATTELYTLSLPDALPIFPIATDKLPLLEHAAINHHLLTTRFEAIARSRNLTIGTQEMNLH